MNPIRAAKGTRDILPGEVEAWQAVEHAAGRVFGLYGYREVRTPLFEATALFRKSTGEDTDIVTKEMYTFEDRSGRSLTLRPEGTPGVVRALLEAGLCRTGQIDRYWYVGPMFRYERPQKGRSRQFSQIGVEAFGSGDPVLDVEVIDMALRLFDRIGIGGEGTLHINSVGHAECRDAYRDALRSSLTPRRDDLCEDCRRRLDRNPLRVLDCKVPGCQPVKAEAPVILEHLCADCRAHFDAVSSHLKALGIPFEVNPRLVRGLDYYTRTTFEITGAGLGAQNALCGGGRYDTLVRDMGGPDMPAVGFAMGMDRIVLEMRAAADRGEAAWEDRSRPDVYVAHVGEAALREAMTAAHALRGREVRVVLDPAGRDLRRHLAKASSLGARFVLIVGDEELERSAYALKDLDSGQQRDVAARDWDALAGSLRGRSPGEG